MMTRPEILSSALAIHAGRDPSSGAQRLCLSSLFLFTPVHADLITMRLTLLAIGLAGAAIAAPQPLQRRQAVSDVSSAVSSASSSAVSSVSAVSSASASASSSASAASPSASANVTAEFLQAVRARDATAFASLLDTQPALVQQIVSLAGTVRPLSVSNADTSSRSRTR